MTRRLRSLAELAVTGLLYFFVPTCLAQGYVIPTGSMEATLLIGDHLIVDKVSYAPPDTLAGDLLPHREIERGAIIVFRYPLNLEESYIKRVIGLPGDRVRIARTNGSSSTGRRSTSPTGSSSILGASPTGTTSRRRRRLGSTTALAAC